MKEIIAVIPRNKLREAVYADSPVALEPFLSFMERESVENDESYVQPIPYAAVIDKNGRIFIYRRTAGEERLREKLSIGVGGHVRKGEDILGALKREIQEEIGFKPDDIQYIKFLGYYYGGDQPVDRVHLAAMFKVKLKDTAIEIWSRELEGRFVSEISAEEYEKLEFWSKALLEMLGEKK